MTNTELKKCSKCGCTMLLETYFEKNRKGEWLKTCNRCREKAKQSRDGRKDKLKEQKRLYYEKNKEKVKEKVKEYYNNNKEKVQAREKEYRDNNREKLNSQSREYYAKNRESELEKRKQYIKDKRHYCKHKTIKRICRICNPQGHMKNLVCRRIHTALEAKKSEKTIEYLGCDIQTFREHIEKSFKKNMTWENQGHGGWEIDHIIPISYAQDGIKPSVEEVRKRLHYTNCQAMWEKENTSKGNRYVGNYQQSE